MPALLNPGKGGRRVIGRVRWASQDKDDGLGDDIADEAEDSGRGTSAGYTIQA